MRRTAIILALVALAATPILAAGPAAAEKQAERKDAAQAAAQNRVEQREANQQRRIQQGIKKGSLTPAETSKLESLEGSIKDLDAKFQGEGPLTKEESHTLEDKLNEASLQIWAEKHNTDGTQMPVLRLGKDIVADPSLTDRIDSGKLTRAEAHAFMSELGELVRLKRRLAMEDLTAEQRTKLQDRYNELLSKYFHNK